MTMLNIRNSYKSARDLGIILMKKRSHMVLIYNCIEFNYIKKCNKRGIEIYKCKHRNKYTSGNNDIFSICTYKIYKRISDGLYLATGVHDNKCYKQINEKQRLLILNNNVIEYVKHNSKKKINEHLNYARRYNNLIVDLNKISTGIKRKLRNNYNSEIIDMRAVKKRKLND